jgi:hypothetical protein
MRRLYYVLAHTGETTRLRNDVSTPDEATCSCAVGPSRLFSHQHRVWNSSALRDLKPLQRSARTMPLIARSTGTVYISHCTIYHIHMHLEWPFCMCHKKQAFRRLISSSFSNPESTHLIDVTQGPCAHVYCAAIYFAAVLVPPSPRNPSPQPRKHCFWFEESCVCERS